MTPAEVAFVRAEFRRLLLWGPFIVVGFLALFAGLWGVTP